MRLCSRYKRWNSWGTEGFYLSTPHAGFNYLSSSLGQAAPLPEAQLSDCLRTISASRLDKQQISGCEFITIDPEIRLRHARGQSFPDWLALKSGKIRAFPESINYPDAVAFPDSPEQVRFILELAKSEDLNVIPYGGGTSVTGHINTVNSKRSSITVSMSHMNELLELDEAAQIATLGAGANGPQVEAQLRQRGFTLGHFPQSFEYSTIGGWIATRSSGQQSLKYGRIEQLYLGGCVETLNGRLDLPVTPASSAGFDLKSLILGSEGRVGIITEAKLKISPAPQHEVFSALFFKNESQAIQAIKCISHFNIGLSMVRLSLAEETYMQLKLTHNPSAVGWLESYLNLKGYRNNQKCLMFIGLTGSARSIQSTWKQLKEHLKPFPYWVAPKAIGNHWIKGRFTFPYLRENLWQAGYGVDTIETALVWPKVESLVNKLEHRLKATADENNFSIKVFTHLSHIYPQGSSSYTTLIFPVAPTYEETYTRWLTLKQTASRLINIHGGTISHQHGVGLDHKPYLFAEKGKLGMKVIKNHLELFDPDLRMNPEKLISTNGN